MRAMPRKRLAGLASLAVAWATLSCAGVPPPSAPVVSPPVAEAAPALWQVPRAEASPRGVAAPKVPWVSPPRSEGKRHALQRTADGILVLSEERGVLGFLKSPVPGAELQWAGFVDDDAVL